MDFITTVASGVPFSNYYPAAPRRLLSSGPQEIFTGSKIFLGGGLLSTMSRITFFSLLPESQLPDIIESLGIVVARPDSSNASLPTMIEGCKGSEISDEIQRRGLNASTVVAVCDSASGLPVESLCLSQTLLKSPKGGEILRAWIGDPDDDPSQALLAQISHDMRSPLSVISTAASLIKRHQQDTGKVSRYLTMINESSGVLASLVNDILDYSKIRKGEFVFTDSEFDLHQLLHSLVHSFVLLVKNPEELRVELEIEAGVPDFVGGDPGRLRQVLTNLLNNALKFTANGAIRLKVMKDAENLLLFELSDTGIGIAREALDRIFLPYQQADSKTHVTFGGTGLGLTICRILVERMGGAVGVRSKVGQGSTFFFTACFPAVARRQTVQLPDLKGYGVFLAAAQPTHFLSVVSPENSCTLASSVSEALELLGRVAFDLYIIDVELDGFSLAEQVLRDHREAIVVVTTSAGRRGDVGQCQALGVSAYLTTPMETEEIKTALALAMRSRWLGVVTKYSAREYLAALC